MLPLSIINEDADRVQSMRTLAEKGLRPITYQEAFVYMMQDQEIKERLKGKLLWLAGKGLEANGYHTIDGTGNIKPGQGDPELTVYVFSGSRPLSLLVYSYVQVDRRFYLNAQFSPTSSANAIIGVPTSEAVARSIIEEGDAALRRLRRNSLR